MRSFSKYQKFRTIPFSRTTIDDIHTTRWERSWHLFKRKAEFPLLVQFHRLTSQAQAEKAAANRRRQAQMSLDFARLQTNPEHQFLRRLSEFKAKKKMGMFSSDLRNNELMYGTNRYLNDSYGDFDRLEPLQARIAQRDEHREREARLEKYMQEVPGDHLINYKTSVSRTVEWLRLAGFQLRGVEMIRNEETPHRRRREMLERLIDGLSLKQSVFLQIEIERCKKFPVLLDDLPLGLDAVNDVVAVLEERRRRVHRILELEERQQREKLDEKKKKRHFLRLKEQMRKNKKKGGDGAVVVDEEEERKMKFRVDISVKESEDGVEEEGGEGEEDSFLVCDEEFDELDEKGIDSLFPFYPQSYSSSSSLSEPTNKSYARRMSATYNDTDHLLNDEAEMSSMTRVQAELEARVEEVDVELLYQKFARRYAKLFGSEFAARSNFTRALYGYWRTKPHATAADLEQFLFRDFLHSRYMPSMIKPQGNRQLTAGVLMEFESVMQQLEEERRPQFLELGHALAKEEFYTEDRVASVPGYDVPPLEDIFVWEEEELRRFRLEMETKKAEKYQWLDLVPRPPLEVGEEFNSTDDKAIDEVMKVAWKDRRLKEDQEGGYHSLWYRFDVASRRNPFYKFYREYERQNWSNPMLSFKERVSVFSVEEKEFLRQFADKLKMSVETLKLVEKEEEDEKEEQRKFMGEVEDEEAVERRDQEIEDFYGPLDPTLGDEEPIEIMEVKHYPKMDKDGIRPDRDRKVWLRVKVAGLKLRPEVRDRLLQLVGNRYNPKNDVLSLSCRRFEDKEKNLKLLEMTFRSLLSEAQVANPNFVALNDYYLSPLETATRKRAKGPYEARDEDALNDFYMGFCWEYLDPEVGEESQCPYPISLGMNFVPPQPKNQWEQKMVVYRVVPNVLPLPSKLKKNVQKAKEILSQI